MRIPQNIRILVSGLICLLAGILPAVAANGSAPYLIINLTSGNMVMMALNDDFRIDNLGEEISLKITGQPSYISLDEIESLGFIYFPANTSSVESLESDSERNWDIYDLSGLHIRHSFSRKPDLSGLKPNNVYLIKSESGTFKYIPYR